MRTMSGPSPAELREALPVTSRVAYLNAGSWGPLTKAAAEAYRVTVDSELDDGRVGSSAIETFIGAYSGARQAFAGALGSVPERIALTHSTTGAVNLALGGLELRPGDEVVTTDAEHPGLDEPLDVLTERRGIVVHRAAVFGVADPLGAITAFLGPRTRLVAVSHVLWGNGAVMPIPAVAAAAHEAGALCLVDGAQAIGAIPFRVDELGADLYAVPGQKWLCGPSGTGALWMTAAMVDGLAPAQPSFLMRDHFSDGHPLWPDARRFDGSMIEPAVLLALAASVRWRSEAVGWEWGFERSAALTAHAREVLRGVEGVDVVEPGPHAGTLVTFTCGRAEPENVARALEGQRVLIRPLPKPRALRASLGFWNDEDDVARLAAALRAL
jgi:L-cysteine/cystine lyase